MEGDKDDNDQSDDIKSNEGHSDKKLPMVYHSKLTGATKIREFFTKSSFNNRHIFLFNKSS